MSSSKTRLTSWGFPGRPIGDVSKLDNPSGGGGGLPGPGERDRLHMKLSEPQSFEDGEEGMNLTLFWCPASRIREVDGTEYPDIIAPKPQRGPLTRRIL